MNRFAIASALLGFALITAGATWIYKPLGPIVAGILLIAAAFMANRK